MTNSVQLDQRFTALMSESTGSVPRPIPPHAPLASGGWYHGASLEEVLGPGRFPVEVPGDKSVGLALALTLVFGPFGLCYLSLPGGLICVALTSILVFLFGAAPLLIVWPLAMLMAGIIASAVHLQHQRR
jgi:hypothetical protein